MDKKELEKKKMALVGELNKVQKKIDDYGLLDVAYDNGPFKDFIIRRDSIKYEIEKIKKDLDNN